LIQNLILPEDKFTFLSDPTEELNIIAISDNDPTRSPSPNSAIQAKSTYEILDGHAMSMNGNTQVGTPSQGRIALPLNRTDSNSQRLVLKTRVDHFHQSSSPAPPGSGHPTFHTTSNGIGSRRPRPETSHQKAVNMNRKMRVDHILHSRIQYEHRHARENRSRYRSSFGLMVMNRVKDLPDMYDSDGEKAHGPGGLLPSHHEMEDFGEEALSYKKAIDRAIRRLYREENATSTGGVIRRHRKGKRKARSYADEDEKDRAPGKRQMNDRSRALGFDRSRNGGRREETLDDLDLALLGEGQDEDDEMDDETGMDDTEDGDMTEDEVMNEI